MTRFIRYHGAVYRLALRPEQRERKKDWLLQQHRGIPTWEEIWTEIKNRESEWSRYVEKEAQRLHPDWEEKQVGTVTVGGLRDFADEEVEILMSNLDPDLWRWLQTRNKKGKDSHLWEYDHLFGAAYGQLTDQRNDEVQRLLPQAEWQVKQDVYQQYRRLVDQLQRADGKPCWRAMMIRRTIDPMAIQQVGRYWTVEHEAAQPYWANKSGINWDTHRIVVWKARIDISQIDWKETAGARFIVGYGDREKEVRFFKYAKIWVNELEIFDHPDSWYTARKPDRVVPIRQTLRA